jgi:2-polyprenyl-3-methyl-5-hydroxy-6-metoxy-1,4-benzoquinol methylase
MIENEKVGSERWNDKMYEKHPTPYSGIAGIVEKYRVSRIIDKIKKYKEHKRVSILEIGCERGKLLEKVAGNLCESQCIGLDISSKALEDARNRLPDRVKLIKGDITQDIHEEINSDLDFILCSETLEHIPDVESAIENIKRISSEETILIITVPIERIKNSIKKVLSKTGLFEMFFESIEKGMSEWHVNRFEGDDLEKLFTDKFEIESKENILYMHRMIVAQKSISK